MSRPLKEIIFERRTVHNYKSEPIPRAILEEALACAIQAPNHHLTAPWRFTVLGSESRKKIIELACAAKKKKKGSELSKPEKIAVEKKFSDPGAIVVVSCMRSDDSLQSREDYASVSCAIQNLSLFLWSEGYGSKWGSGALTRMDKTYDIFGINQEKEEIIGFIYAGVPERVPRAPERPSVDSVSRWID